MNVTTNLYSIIGEYAEKIYDEIVDRRRPIRRVGYCFADLMKDVNEQYDFFTDLKKIDKEKKLVASIISLHDKYGKNTILKGIDLEEKATQKERNETIGGHKSGEGKNVTGGKS